MMKRGDIHYIVDDCSAVGSEQRAGRPAIIVSNNNNNAHNGTVEVVYLTTSPKADTATHVVIRSAAKISTALCEQITSVSIERIGEYVGECTPQEMQAMNTALSISLALSPDTPSANDAKLIEDLRIRLGQEMAAKEMYRTMYDDITNKILDRRA